MKRLLFVSLVLLIAAAKIHAQTPAKTPKAVAPNPVLNTQDLANAIQMLNAINGELPANVTNLANVVPMNTVMPSAPIQPIDPQNLIKAINKLNAISGSSPNVTFTVNSVGQSNVITVSNTTNVSSVTSVQNVASVKNVTSVQGIQSVQSISNMQKVQSVQNVQQVQRVSFYTNFTFHSSGPAKGSPYPDGKAPAKAMKVTTMGVEKPAAAKGSTYQEERKLLIKNDSKEPFDVFLLMHTKLDAGFAWMPTAPEMKTQVIRIGIEPGASFLLNDGMKDWTGNKLRIWARSPTRQWLDYYERDLWMIDADATGARRYLGDEMDVFTIHLSQ